MKNIKTIAGAIGLPLLVSSLSVAAAMEEVVVTAQKREQSILEVPLTMDVVQSAFLERTNTTELDDLSRILPNVVIQEQAVSLPSFNIRGITDDTAAVSATPRISVYQDGIDISKKTTASAALFDVERIEVLKGPQPTLFGVAAANGAISIITKLPSDELELDGRIAFNTESGTEFQAMVNIPLNDNFSFRLASLIREQDGAVKNKACGADSYNASGLIANHKGELKSCGGGDLNGVSVQAVRASLKADFDNFDVVLRLASERNDQPGISFKSGSIAPKNGDTSPFSDAELGFGSLLGIERDLLSADITVNYDLAEGILLNAGVYYKDVELAESFDADGSGLRLQDAYFENDATLKGASLRLVFSGGERFEGFIGASYNEDKSILPYTLLVDPYLRGVFDAKVTELEAKYPNIPLNQNVKTSATEAEIAAVRAELVAALFNADGTPVSDPNFPAFVTSGPFVFASELKIKSLVAEGTYAINERLSLTAGLRYLDETRYTKNFGAFEAEEDFSDTLPRLALNYAYNESLSFYFNYAEGRRSPVVDPNFGNTKVTAAELVNSYDVGFKFIGDRFSLNAAMFAYTYTDYQQSFTDAVTLQSNTITVGDSDMYGFEATLNYAVSDSLRFSTSLGLLDAEFADKTDGGTDFDYAGNKFRLAPEVSGAFNVNKTFRVSNWTVDMDFLTSYQSEVFFESSNYPGLSQDAYWLSDVSIKFSMDNKPWQFEIYADNVFDEEYLIDAGNTGGGLGIPTFVRGTPMVAGIRFYASM